MSYRRVLLITEIGADVGAALVAARAVAAGAETLVVTALPAGPAGAAPAESVGPASPPLVAWLDSVRAAAAAVAGSADVAILDGPDAEKLEALADSCQADLVVVGPRPAEAIAMAAELRRRRSVAVLWAPPSMSRGDRTLAEVLCIAVGARARGALGAFLRDHGGPDLNVRVLSVPRMPEDELSSGLDVAGIRARVTIVARRGVPPWRALDDAVREDAWQRLARRREWLRHWPGVLSP